MEKPERDPGGALFTVGRVAMLCVVAGLLVSLVAVYPFVAIIAPRSLPMGFPHGLASGVPFAYVVLRIAAVGTSFTAGRSFVVGLLFIFFTEVIGAWSWFALTAMGVHIYTTAFVLGLACSSALPFFTLCLRSLGKRLTART